MHLRVKKTETKHAAEAENPKLYSKNNGENRQAINRSTENKQEDSNEEDMAKSETNQGA